MKRFKNIIYFLLVLFIFGACGDDKAVSYLNIKTKLIEVISEGEIVTINIDSDEDWKVSTSYDWIKFLEQNSKSELKIEIAANNLLEVREGDVSVTTLSGLTETISVRQEAGLLDGSYYSYTKASVGNGINIVLLGDGFIAEDCVSGGKYDKSMEQAVEHLFDIEPYKSYRDYFTTWIVRAISNDEGISDYSSRVDNKFSATYESATSTLMSCDTSLCFKYAKKAPINDNLSETVIILVANSSRYAGTCYMFTDGASIAICPMCNQKPYETFKGVVQHEAGGHAFAKLIDEYIYSNEELPQLNKDWIKQNEQYGFYPNIDLTDDLSTIKWSHFIGVEGYEEVDAFEGGYKYAMGVWRPELKSVMDDMRPYFNAPSREAIVKRICELSGMQYTFEHFIANDKVKDTNIASEFYSKVTKSSSIVHAPPYVVVR